MLEELTDLVDEVRLTFHACAEFARQAHGDRIDPSGRAVLEFLSAHGPSTVPAIARSRGVTRQHIQTIANAAESEGLLKTTANPAHKRSPLFALTADGTALIESIRRTERMLLAPLSESFDPAQLAAAAATLAHVRTQLTEMKDPS